MFLFEDYALDRDRRELRRGTDLLSLEPQVFDLLLFLISNRDRVVSRDDLIASVWGGRIVSDSTIASRINAVRKAIGDSGENQRLIRTIARKGIRFVGDVRESPNRREENALGPRRRHLCARKFISAPLLMVLASPTRTWVTDRRWSKRPTILIIWNMTGLAPSGVPSSIGSWPSIV
jgi:DNA-binding winged helix-turn-helix (wHTH) protein